LYISDLDFLKSDGLISQADLIEARALQAHGGGSIASALVRLGVIGDERLAEAVAEVMALPLLTEAPGSSQILAAQQGLRFSLNWLAEQEVLIWRDALDLPCIALASGSNALIEEAMEQWDIAPGRRFVVSLRMLRAVLADLEEGSGNLPASGNIGKLEELAEDAPAIEFINAMLSEAMARRASDIHIEPFKGDMQIRLRIDGTLHLWRTVPGIRFAAIASRIKLLCGMDIAERRTPQDGRYSLRIAGRDIDIRASCLPGVWGESIVLRFLGRTVDLPSLVELGVAPAMAQQLGNLIRQPAGLLLIAGPTGSGKTTTVYNLLEQLNDGSRKIITIEDPVEIDLPGVIQVNVRQDIGLDFATGLRSMLRQDPDVIFVGEIRDPETAQMATRAAMTGHLVISTLHTRSAATSITRMVDLGVEGYLLAEAISGIIAQRLLRRRCADNTYSGRIGVYELMGVDPLLRDAIRRNAPQSELEQIASQTSYRPMIDDARDKADAGLTDAAEIQRVLGDRNG
jgi:general secretion pathway protein E